MFINLFTCGRIQERRLGVISIRYSAATVSSPVGVVVLSGLIFALISVGTEIISLGLDQVGRQASETHSVIVAESSGNSRDGDTVGGSEANDTAPAGQGTGDLLDEEGIEQEVGKLRVLIEGFLDLAQELRADDAATAPHESDASEVQVPLVLLSSGTHKDVTLSIRNDLGSIHGVADVIDQLRAVTRVSTSCNSGRKNLGGLNTVLLEGRQATGKDSLADQGQGLAEIQSGHGSPLSGSLLSSRVQDAIDNVLAGAILLLLAEDVGSDLDQERVQITLVPLGEGISELIVGDAQQLFKEMVRFSNQLHISVLDTVVNHLDEVSGTLLTDPIAARRSILNLGRDLLEDLLDVRPGSSGTTGHDGGTQEGTILTTGNTCNTRK
jgi:hypothetical protein